MTAILVIGAFLAWRRSKQRASNVAAGGAAFDSGALDELEDELEEEDGEGGCDGGCGCGGGCGGALE